MGLGIDLGGDGVTANDAYDFDFGPNDLTNYPVLTRVAGFDGRTFVTGSLTTRRNTSFTIEFFASAAADESGFGEGQLFWSHSAVVTNAAGEAVFDLGWPVRTALGSSITVTATDQNGNTSEFSAACSCRFLRG